MLHGLENMEKEASTKTINVRIVQLLLLLLPFICFDVLWAKNDLQFHTFKSWMEYISGSQNISYNRKIITINYTHVEEKQDSLNLIFSRLLKGEDRKKLEETGFACDSSGVSSIHCVANQAVQIDTETMILTVNSSPNQSNQEETVILHPYARQEDENLLKTVTPVKISLIQRSRNDNNSNTNQSQVCQLNHTIPAVVFSTGGFRGNIFHEINEILIPLFITARLFKSHVQFIVEDYSPQFIRKYKKPLSILTNYEILNPSLNRTVHCFPGAIVGLKFHGHLSLNSRDIPTGLSMQDFRQFLRQSFDLGYSHVSQIKNPPNVLLLSRRRTRRFLNEDEMVKMMEDLGFRVIVVSGVKIVSNLSSFTKIINSCSVFVGVHGAGLTNELFLPDGAVMVQFDLIGLDWAAAAYYGNPARDMGVYYLRYKIEPEESSLLKVFGSRDHVAIRDPSLLPPGLVKEVHLNGQNVRVDIERFRKTMVEAMSLVLD